MAIARKKSHGGAHGSAWVISFADLMSLLMAFFVMLLSFSIQDQEKLNEAAESVQNAFGIVPVVEKAGMIERNGNPLRDFARQVSTDATTAQTEFSTIDHSDLEAQGQEANTYSKERTDLERAQQFALAAASLRQAWQDLPDITRIADQIMIEETNEGIDIVIADRDGRAMFPEGSKYPFELTRRALAAMAPSLQQLPNQIRISGHTAVGAQFENERYGSWELSFDRANMTRQILEESGLGADHIAEVAGRGNADPLFPDAPYSSGNQRVQITVLFQQPPVPAGLAP